MKMEKQKVKDKLVEILNRQPSESEIENAQKDVSISCDLLWEEIKAIKKFLNLS